MGWLYSTRYSERKDRKRLIADILKFEETDKASWTTLRHCLRGNVLWSVQTYTTKATGKEERFIRCDLLAYGGRESGWGYKSLEESCGPNALTCPLSYLKDVPEPDNKQWRADVIRVHSERKARMAKLRADFKLASENGDMCFVEINSPLSPLRVISIKPLRGRANGRTYRIPQKMVKDCEIVPLMRV